MDILRTKSVEHSLEETAEKGRSLKRTLSAWDLAMMGVAVAVGAGIFSVGAQAAAFPCGACCDHQLYYCRGSVCCSRIMLCGVCVNGPCCGISVFLHLYHNRRVHCMDNRMGYDP